MRSYAFRATLPQICKTTMRSYESRLRSIYVPHCFLNVCRNMYAFLCVPCHSRVVRKHHTHLVKKCIIFLTWGSCHTASFAAGPPLNHASLPFGHWSSSGGFPAGGMRSRCVPDQVQQGLAFSDIKGWCPEYQATNIPHAFLMRSVQRLRSICVPCKPSVKCEMLS